MLYCMYCNYLKALEDNITQTDKVQYMCELTGIIFDNDFETIHIEYPCNNVNLAIWVI